MMEFYIFFVLLHSVTSSSAHGLRNDGLSYAYRPELSEDAILVANNGIRVPFGRSVFIDPINDLVIEVQPGDRCRVLVLDNDPLFQRPGHLSPKKFPCEFGPNDVKYSHFGSRSPAGDRVRLQLRYDTQTETIIIPFMLEVEVLFTQLEIVTKNVPLTVDKLHGTSNPITRKILEFTFDRTSEQCVVVSWAARSAIPRYGKVTDERKLENTMDCDAFLRANIRYKHTSLHKSPDRDYIPMTVELRNQENIVLKQEFFHIMVRIKEGLGNTPPKPSFVATMMVEVAQFVMTALTPDMLSAEDTESHPDDLIFNITSPLSYEEGYIVSTDDRNLPLTTFYQRDLKDLKIAYKPPSLDSDTERIFQIEIEVLDTDGGNSDPFAFMIFVKPRKTLAPVVTKNTGQLLYEGQSRPLFTQNNLEISDEDNLDSVRVAVVDGLRHGMLTVLGTSKRHFSPAELQTGIVVYQHDGSDTYSDNIVFRMTDGQNEVEFLFPITVVPTDDEAPIINANTGLVIFKNQTLPVSPIMLSAADIDSEDSLIKFTIEPPFSTIGEVLLRQSEAPEDPSSWKFNVEDGVYEKAVTEWLQMDITEGKLFYRHTGPHIIKMESDQFIFKAQDDADPPNQSDENMFFIRVLPIDDIPPVLCPGTTLQMTVHEYQLTHFRKNVLCYTDLDSVARDLKYIITQPPTDTDENHPVKFGSVVLTGHPNTEVREFTQAQVDHHKISYRPPDTVLGITPHVVQFHFTVEDTAGNGVEETFTIFLHPVNNKPPQITNTGFLVFEQGTHIITNAQLDTTDLDTDSKHISFTLRQTPQHGQIQLNFADMVKGNAFTLADISKGRISYVQNGDETTSDFFKLDVSDGVHVVPITVRIVVKAIDDEMPTLTFPHGTIGSHLDVLENGAIEITTRVIQGKDEDTDDLSLTFMVEDAPAFGEILVNGMLSNRFTHADIISGLVVYTHTSGEIGLSPKQDYFNLTLNDMSDDWTVGGNKVSGIRVHVNILPVDSQTPVVNVVPKFTVLEGDKNTIGSHQIMVEDGDTLPENILCTIIVQPTSGYVENISPAPGSEKSRSGTAVSAFTIRDVNDGHILYVQSIHKGVEPAEDRFTFRCSDGVNFSERQIFPIIIIPTNDEMPEIFTNKILVMEGMNVLLDTPILNGTDADIPDEELTFIISEPPKHGLILNQLTTGSVPVTNFTLEQIKKTSSIIYQHDDSETTEDKLSVMLMDGKHSVEGTVGIIIIAVDDETPRLAINDGLDIVVGQTKELNSKILKATDLDSDDDTLTFIVRNGPGQGILQRKTQLSFENITVGMNFTQTEVDQGHILYIHNGQEGIHDLLKFDVTDGTNSLIDRFFYITVNSIDMVFPDVISKGVSLKEGGKVTLTTDLLSTSDFNNPHENLVFSITRAPLRGHLENTDTPGMPIVSFTQLQLAGSKIFYIHTSDDEIKMDSFEFEVTDGYNPVFRTFLVSIVDVDNKKPVLTVHKLLVTEGHTKLITPFELAIEDQDTAEHLLKFTVTQLPVHGKLLFNDSHPITTFTKQDLNENLISYKHDGTESTQDSFSFTVTDGTHTDFFVFPDTVLEAHRPQRMQISIMPVDNGVPQIVVNKGITTLKTLPSGHLGHHITNEVLKAEDRDSGPGSLFFYVTTQPEHGYLIDLAKGNDAINTFTQADINDLKICYVLNDKDNATSDTIQFSVEGHGGSRLEGLSVQVDWAWISLQSPRYVVDEQAGLLEVWLRRRGYLGETSFVGISTLDSSAEKERDFQVKFQRLVQFNPGQTTAVWQVEILSDGKYEHSETFHVVLSEPVMGALEMPAVATVEIVDPGDESTAFLPQTSLVVEEDAGEVLVPVRRSGDVGEELLVFCYTLAGSATGTAPGPVLSHSDYVSRLEEQASLLRFHKGEVEKPCRVVIIDDSLYEGEESFNVSLSMAQGGRLVPGKTTARVTILPDLDDAPLFYFGDGRYHVDESDSHVEVRVRRTGPDLSKAASVSVRSRRTDPPSAEAGVDYVAISKNLDFAPGVTLRTVRVTILDDLGLPLLEGTERFELVLSMPSNGILGEPGRATVFINDYASDLPTVMFTHAVLVGEESGAHITALVQRHGDISYRCTVRCYTSQGSAQVGGDFDERPNTDASIITFLPGEVEKPCVLTLVDDALYEEEEEMRLVLGSARSDSPYGASIGRQNETLVKITDTADKPIIRFSETKFSAREPRDVGQVTVVRIPVQRVGDLSGTSVVRVHTKDASAVSGEDYHPVSQDVEFKEGERTHVVEVEVLFDDLREVREAFTLHLKPDEHMVAETQATKAIVYIEEASSMVDFTFPSRPHVVSLLHYGDVRRGRLYSQTPAGYPVICVTACDPKHPEYAQTGSICASERINNTLTRYRWLTGTPRGPDIVADPMREVDFDTFFTSTKMITLDSIYFQAGSRVQCSARAFGSDGAEGLELSSPVVSISMDEGMCQRRTAGMVGAEPFSAKLRYTGAEDPGHANLVKLSVTMPHVDGMVPLVSTRALSDLEQILGRDGGRSAAHRCSNLPDAAETHSRHGFLTEATGRSSGVSDGAPYQHSAPLRGQAALRFYQNLNLEACLWEFVAYHDVSELLTDCGANVDTEEQVLNLVQSYVTLRVPLYVSYVFRSPVATGGWQHFDLQSKLQLTFVYDTTILWRDGVRSPPQAQLRGALYPTSMRINEQGRLVVGFRTEARFSGLYVASHPASSLTSMVTSVEHAGLTFNLSLVRNEARRNPLRQLWTFSSDFTVWDYSGTYTVMLIPCVTALNMESSVAAVCSPREPVTFNLDIRFQQVSDPVAMEFSLNTQMLLVSERSAWLSDGAVGFVQESRAAFSKGDVIYVRVMLDPVQNLDHSFSCDIQKVYLCTGADGYVPKYNPPELQFGCLADSPAILYRFKIIDKVQPETQALAFGGVAFNAMLAIDDPETLVLVKQPSSDGFRLDSAPLFQVAAGREWYIHTVYTVRSRDYGNRDKRSVHYHSFTAAQGTDRGRRSARPVPAGAADIGSEKNRGTNIVHISLERRQQRWAGPVGELFADTLAPQTPDGPQARALTLAGASVGLLLSVLLVAVLVVAARSGQPEAMGTQKASSSSIAARPVLVRSGFRCPYGSEV